MNLYQYLQDFSRCLNSKNGEALSQLLSYSHQEHSQSESLLRVSFEDQVSKHIIAPWDEMAILHLHLCYKLSQSQFIGAFKAQTEIIQLFTKAIQSMNNENWMCPVLNVLIRDLRLLAIAADHEASLVTNVNRKSPCRHQHMELSAKAIMGLFRITAQDTRSGEKSKRVSMMHIINQLFKIYNKIENQNLCDANVRALENAQNSQNAKNSQLSFKLVERVTYNYFVGRSKLLNGQYREAEKLLSFAFRNCDSQSHKNKRLILIFLIPAKILLGFMPSVRLLKEYDLMQFNDYVNAVKLGDLRSLDKALDINADFFWKYSIYTILEKVKAIAYRNVVKKVMLILQTHQISIEHLTKAINFLQDEKMCTDQVHCILSNLVYDQRIKGYISIYYQKLVVSKTNPFPKLSLTNVTYLPF